MAFRQPTKPPQRPIFASVGAAEKPTTEPSHESPYLSEEWILFSPSQAEASPTTSTDRATNASRLSDFGSLNAGLQSRYEDDLSDIVEDDDELDSLDDGLLAFHEPSIPVNSKKAVQSGETILPAHDGLGTFAASGSPAQEQIWDFERHNLHRASHGHQRPSKLRLQQSTAGTGFNTRTSLDHIRKERIEKWALDQSKILLSELEQEATKRPFSRKRSRTREPIRNGACPAAATHTAYDEGSIANVSNDRASAEVESLMQRIVRKVIQDLLGIDDSVLGIMFGETLLAERPVTSPTDASRVLSQSNLEAATEAAERWEERLFRRLAKELGILAHQISLCATLKVNSTNTAVEYAGMPVDQQLRKRTSEDCTSACTESDLADRVAFGPTLGKQPRNDSIVEKARQGFDKDGADDRFTLSEQEYWEQTPDIKTIFNYLSRRFISRKRHSPDLKKSSVATTQTPQSLRRAAVIRQQHPLVSRTSMPYEGRRRHLPSGGQHSFDARGYRTTTSLKRAGTSCASLSTKRSRRGGSDCGSRNYWDIGASLDSGSAVLGGVGIWGEV